MNTTTSIKNQLLEQEARAFSRIPGMDQLRRTPAGSNPDVAMQYPDAAFVLMVLDSLHLGNREQDEIHQKAYLSILHGDSIQEVRFRYDRDQEAFLQKHNWD